MQEVRHICEDALQRGIIKRIILSKPAAGVEFQRIDVTPFQGKGKKMVQFAMLAKDNKMHHKNLSFAEAPDEICSRLKNEYRQMNLITTQGECQVMIGKKGPYIQNKIAEGGQAMALASHDRTRQHVLKEGIAAPFLVELGIMDRKGHVFDRARSKFRQINRFLEILRDVCTELNDSVRVCDLCCGKAYLTFAAYHYLAYERGLQVDMVGIDWKADVMADCNAIAKKLGYDGLHFESMDIRQYVPAGPVDVVLSLHACDTATDLVLFRAVQWGAARVLSAPCCQHELAGQIDKKALPPITNYPALRQRLCETATDALRAAWLRAQGYAVQIIEFVGLEDTPKNLLIRAVQQKRRDDAKEGEALQQCKTLCSQLGVYPTLLRLSEGEEVEISPVRGHEG